MQNLSSSSEPFQTLAKAAILKVKPRTRDQLYEIIKACLGTHLSRRPATEGHSCLLDIAWEVISRQYLNFLIVGPRGGGKTRLVTTIEFLEAGWGLKELFHVGAIVEQAKQGYSYVLDYAKLPHVRPLLDGQPLLSQTRWRNGAMLSIHAGTLQQVSSKHPGFKTFDELERAKPRVVKQFTGMGIEDTVSIYLSTRESAVGLVQLMIDKAQETGTPRLHFLDMWDTKAPCPDCIKSECLLWEDCQGRYKDTDGHRSRKALEQRKAETDEDTWNVQFKMLEPGTQSLVWQNFSEANKADVSFNPDLPFEVWCDDNVAAPRAIIFVQIVGSEIHVFDSMYEPHKTQDQAVADILARGYGEPELAVVLSGESSLKQAFHNAEISTYGLKNYRRKAGADAARMLIRNAQRHSAIKIHPGAGQNATMIRHLRRHYRNEVEPGVYSEEPAKHPRDHFPDAFSYGCWYHRRMSS